ncbi:hypothetical protein ACWDTG_17830 [Rhodococcus zopfii]|uniref:hypothetical protein n=1 Tax=Rhodococcus zopfii TaxID=43772 RepID=UPI001EDCC1A4|nr:hypothetical protein [Rhodococcus zopfii]
MAGTPPAAGLAERVADAVLAVPDVAGLHGGAFGEIATYLPGRRIEGIRIGSDLCAVHIVARYPADLPAVAEAVRARVAPMVAMPVQVTIEDLHTGENHRPGEKPRPGDNPCPGDNTEAAP